MASALYNAPVLTGRRLPRERVAAIQRQKILASTINELDVNPREATLARIIAGARVSRGAFYAHFADRDACVAAVLEQAAEAVARGLLRAGVDALPWEQRVGAGLRAILRHLDAHPALARVCVVESLRCGPQVLGVRTRLLARLAACLDEGRTRSDCSRWCTPTTAEGLVGAVYAIVHARLSARGERLEPLAGELTAMLLLAYRATPGEGAVRASSQIVSGD